ncbi:hypothetical protein BdWA1_003261 [Babesia duncani]|uniref:Uncharacterized protein n=1 Tax=Babesia duncani TaxID=323732 RepID=A0AAD9PIN0_9APIC|nr:hypothetical protein BdWA1_003261 [Babesia duncani]
MTMFDLCMDPASIKSVADSLKSSGVCLYEGITYEINGPILTWIARHRDCELKYQCRTMCEIIDGYYKAEYFLDTRKTFTINDTQEYTFTSWSPGESNTTQEEPWSQTNYVSQQSVLEALRRLKKRAGNIGQGRTLKTQRLFQNDMLENNYTLRGKRMSNTMSKNEISENFWIYEQIKKEYKRVQKPKEEGTKPSDGPTAAPVAPKNGSKNPKKSKGSKSQNARVGRPPKIQHASLPEMLLEDPKAQKQKAPVEKNPGVKRGKKVQGPPGPQGPPLAEKAQIATSQQALLLPEDPSYQNKRRKRLGDQIGFPSTLEIAQMAQCSPAKPPRLELKPPNLLVSLPLEVLQERGNGDHPTRVMEPQYSRESQTYQNSKVASILPLFPGSIGHGSGESTTPTSTKALDVESTIDSIIDDEDHKYSLSDHLNDHLSDFKDPKLLDEMSIGTNAPSGPLIEMQKRDEVKEIDNGLIK